MARLHYVARPWGETHFSDSTFRLEVPLRIPVKMKEFTNFNRLCEHTVCQTRPYWITVVSKFCLQFSVGASNYIQKSPENVQKLVFY